MDTSIYGSLATRIRERRTVLGLSQQQTALLAGITRSSLASIETGRQSVLLHHVYAIARALEIAPHELLPPVEAAAAAERGSRPRRVELFVASLVPSSASMTGREDA